MSSYNIVVFAGDHCGPEVTAEGLKILRAIEKSSDDIKFSFQEHNLGGASIDATGEPLTDEALNAAKNADAVLLGAIGGPKWGTGKVRPEQGILKLRKEMGTYGNLRPCFFASESLVEQSPLKAEVCKGTNFNIVRELTGGIYFGERKEDDGSGHALDTEPYSRQEIERVTRLAAYLALAEDPPAPIWSLDKANVMATSRLWRKTVTEVMEKEFPQLKLGHHLIDSAAMLMVKNPRALNGVIVTSNLFGDIISDEASVIPGSLGLLPSASLTANPDGKGKCNGIYEPIHGSAPDISGKGVVNPVAMLLSVSMMLKYSFQRLDLSQKVDEAVKNVIDKGIRTKDIGGSASTSEVGDAVAKELEALLKRSPSALANGNATPAGYYSLSINGLEDKAEYRHGPAGLSLHSKVDLKPGEHFCYITAHNPAPSPNWRTIQTSATTHTEPQSALLCMNHSCSPSVELHVYAPNATGQYPEGRAGEVRVAGDRGLKTGDALTFFYPSTELAMDRPFACSCGEKGCLGQVSGATHLSKDVLARYYINEHVKRAL
ncbi:3-isopropylmalate, partial [Hortaea werneckii]|uniref:3-isopropylmalate dehydrogenase n=1 Tax=Hortaea werneckii TaxID=91943 RepID=A0A3M7C745_HORWE